jgi:prolipoprotein diacylglyceryl transferase
MYGVILAVGVLVAVWVSERRWRNRGCPRDGIYDIAFWVVVWGVIGARLYHVVTDYQLFTDDPLRAFEIWRGGLGIWGAVLGGGIAVAVLTKRRHLDTLAVMDCMAPGIILAQAIGRWGNYFNQELFGKPTTLPWALEIAPAHRPLGYAQYATFQPTFLYESLYCLAVFSILLAVEHHWRLKRGQTFAPYVCSIRSAASGLRTCASIPRTTSPVSVSTRGCRSVCSSRRSRGSSGLGHTFRSSDALLPCNQRMR